jgi:hypothetical protein
MNRILYLVGFGYIALCVSLVVNAVVSSRSSAVVPPAGLPVVVGPAPTPAPLMPGAQWFAAMKPYCNQVEVEVRTRFTPPPSTSEGAGYLAACFALAGKLDRARTIIETMPADQRGSAANVLFEVAHPVADAGDDRASGPMMELVLDYWPNNYMALYHAGMSEHSLGQTALADTHLRAFLRLYNAPDGFTNAARSALAKIEAEQPGPKAVERENSPRP